MAKTTEFSYENHTWLPNVADFTKQANITTDPTLTYGDWNYQIQGDWVEVWGMMAVSPDVVNVSTQLYVPIPIATDIQTSADLIGVGSGTNGVCWGIRGGTTTNNAVFQTKPIDAVNSIVSFNFRYRLR